MPEALLVFTFSPVQPFILEARRTADLFSGSSILVALARAAAESVKAVPDCRLIFPVKLSNDVPNKLVARLPWEAAKKAAEDAAKALRTRWREIAAPAGLELRRVLTPDATWEEIWERQIASHWEVYWAAARLGDGPGAQAYRDAYEEANRALDAAKRTRSFTQSVERGLKDSLSGRREALHTDSTSAKQYWSAITASGEVRGSKLQPEGKERLDALGAIKRFGEFGREGFLSTSSIAAADFLAAAKQQAPAELAAYRTAVETLLGESLFPVNRNEAAWPYDGDLFYRDTLSAEQLKDRYGFTVAREARLTEASRQLKQLREAVTFSLSPYFAVVALDGDSMGESVSDCLEQPDPEKAHAELSQRLTEFAAAVKQITDQHRAQLVYNGGDDVLQLAPLAQALPVTAALARKFNELTGATASAGIAVAHHLSPLDAALAAARTAEKSAKNVPGKKAVAVQVLKRSGETLVVRSSWDALGDHLSSLVNLLHEGQQGAPLAGRFVSDLAASAGAFAAADAPFTSELRRLLAQHGNANHADWAERLSTWAQALPEGEQVDGLVRWVQFARFVARGGEE